MKRSSHRRLRCIALLSAMLVPWTTPCRAAAEIPIANQSVALAGSVAKAIVKYFGKEGASEASEFLSKKGGREMMERVSASATREGGEATVEQVSKLATKYGPEAIVALDNGPSVQSVLNALDELPTDQVRPALAKLAAGAPGRELADATTKFGVRALQSELKHPGVGLVLVRSLGDDGAELATRLSSDQAIAVARHAEDLAKLPPTARSNILGMIRDDATRMVQFLGRFAEANPGKTLFTVAATGIILAEPDRILGGDEIIYDADGNPILISKSGLAGRTLAAGGSIAEHVSTQYVRPVFLTALAFVTTFAILWASLKLWRISRKPA
ncbi:hypothetical protein [Rubripirellula reticaptiva]|uniref:DUF4197 domain-containing protein n=1 Tax=Rubripirellula reticaptiva TaxID=2528013 RepID=A0A5C6EHQ9_9BACT|nr:hypothetical protein [Rubripirellula reticaptiva]TWU48080.1 hypothetical protein Poly59_49250 [Rubripirellula reticaptiva]